MTDVSNPSVIFEVFAVEEDVVRMFGCYRMPETMSVWVYEGGQVVVETSGQVDMADVIQISQRCRDVSSRIPQSGQTVSDYRLRPDADVRLVYSASSSSRCSVARTGFVRTPNHYNLKILEGGLVVVTTGGMARPEQIARLRESCSKAGFEVLVG